MTERERINGLICEYTETIKKLKEAREHCYDCIDSLNREIADYEQAIGDCEGVLSQIEYMDGELPW